VRFAGPGRSALHSELTSPSSGAAQTLLAHLEGSELGGWTSVAADHSQKRQHWQRSSVKASRPHREKTSDFMQTALEWLQCAGLRNGCTKIGGVCFPFHPCTAHQLRS